MSRSKLREKVFRLLFRIEFHEREEFQSQKDAFFLEEEQEQMTEEEQGQVAQRCEQIKEKLADIDALLSERTTGWSIQRIGKVELAILRLAVYEIEFDESIPVSVSINEAVELAKRYGAEESSGFIKGVLAKFADKE